jgi:Type IV secretion system pilin
MKYIITSLLYFFISLPITVFAQGGNTTGGPSGGNAGEGNTTGGPSGGNAASDGGRGDLSYTLQNPLKFESIQDFIVAVLNVIIVIATPIIVIFIIFAGFQYVTAKGNPEAIKNATRSLTYAIIGGVLIIGAVAIAEIIKGLVTAFS